VARRAVDPATRSPSGTQPGSSNWCLPLAVGRASAPRGGRRCSTACMWRTRRQVPGDRWTARGSAATLDRRSFPGLLSCLLRRPSIGWSSVIQARFGRHRARPVSTHAAPVGVADAALRVGLHLRRRLIRHAPRTAYAYPSRRQLRVSRRPRVYQHLTRRRPASFGARPRSARSREATASRERIAAESTNSRAHKIPADRRSRARRDRVHWVPPLLDAGQRVFALGSSALCGNVGGGARESLASTPLQRLEILEVGRPPLVASEGPRQARRVEMCIEQLVYKGGQFG
jgi:hypothetical protein